MRFPVAPTLLLLACWFAEPGWSADGKAKEVKDKDRQEARTEIRRVAATSAAGGEVMVVPLEPKPANVRAEAFDDLIAADFAVAANTCFTFPVVTDVTGAERVAITILALNQNLQDTAIVPFFGVRSARFMSAAQPIRATDFLYVDGGGATIPVLGPLLRLRVCNNADRAITYTHVTAYAVRQ